MGTEKMFEVKITKNLPDIMTATSPRPKPKTHETQGIS